jgi:hypothetical protein
LQPVPALNFEELATGSRQVQLVVALLGPFPGPDAANDVGEAVQVHVHPDAIVPVYLVQVELVFHVQDGRGASFPLSRLDFAPGGLVETLVARDPVRSLPPAPNAPAGDGNAGKGLGGRLAFDRGDLGLQQRVSLRNEGVCQCGGRRALGRRRRPVHVREQLPTVLLLRAT